MDELLPHYEVELRRLADATRFVVQYSALAQRLASRYPATSTARGPVGVQAAVVTDTTVVQTWTR